MAKQFFGAVIAFALLLGAPAGRSRAAEPGESMAALVTAAKAEGSVTVSGPAIDVVREALAQGTYPIWVGTEFSTLETFKKAGYPIAAIAPADGPGILTGSDGLISLMNRAPHPNAAKLYVNWIAGHDGGLLFAKALLAGSLRTDFKQDWMPSYELMKPGVKYYDAYEYKFVTVERDAALAKVRDLLGF
jgi:ABC-type Fe3+ transport system substrate-binding protein